MQAILQKYKNFVEWCKTDEIRIVSDIIPHCDVKIPTPNPTKEELKAIKAKPFINHERVMFTIYYKMDQYVLLFDRGYDWDGATIPAGFRWIIGSKGSPEFLIPSMVHDKLCEKHSFIKNNRYLSSLIFKSLLLASGVGKTRADIMFNAVDNFQKFFGGWKEEKQ